MFATLGSNLSYSWHLDLYKQLNINTYVAAFNNGVTIVKETVGVGRHIILKMNSHLIKQGLPDCFENTVVFITLNQTVGRGSEVRLSIWDSLSWNHNTDMW